MTQTATPPLRTPRRRLVIGLALLVIAGAATYWQVSARTAIADVSIVPESLVCNGKPVAYGIDRDELDAPRPAFMFSMAPDDECLLTVAVVNDSSRSVRIDSLTFPSLRPGDSSGIVIEIASHPNDALKARSDDPDSMDAVFDVDESISAGGWISERFILRYRVPSSSCSGGITGSPNLPVAHVSQSYVTADVTGSTTLLITSSPPPADVPNDCD